MKAVKLKKAKEEQAGNDNLAQMLKDKRRSNQMAGQPTDGLPD
jgi:hypothetical protein